MQSLVFKKICLTFLPVLFFLKKLSFINVTSGAQSDSLMKAAGMSRTGCLTDVFGYINNQPLIRVIIKTEINQKDSTPLVSGDYFFVPAPGKLFFKGTGTLKLPALKIAKKFIHKNYS